MSSLWISLSLLYVVLHQVSTDEGVKLICNKMATVRLEDSVTLNCSIKWTLHEQSCIGTEFRWRHTDDDGDDSGLCDSDWNKYTCEWDNLTYVSLTILSVSEEKNYTVEMFSNCGMDHFSSIAVQVNETIKTLEIKTEETPSHVTATVLGVLSPAAAVAILCFLLFLTFKRRKPEDVSDHRQQELL